MLQQQLKAILRPILPSASPPRGSGGVGEWDSGEMGRGSEWENISSSFNI